MSLLSLFLTSIELSHSRFIRIFVSLFNNK